MDELKDIQKQRPKNGMEIDEVGISKIKLPFTVIDRKKRASTNCWKNKYLCKFSSGT